MLHGGGPGGTERQPEVSSRRLQVDDAAVSRCCCRRSPLSEPHRRRACRRSHKSARSRSAVLLLGGFCSSREWASLGQVTTCQRTGCNTLRSVATTFSRRHLGFRPNCRAIPACRCRAKPLSQRERECAGQSICGKAFPDNRYCNPALRHWPLIKMPVRNGPILPRSEPQMNKTAKGSKTIRANKRKAKLRAKHRRQRARATA